MIEDSAESEILTIRPDLQREFMSASDYRHGIKYIYGNRQRCGIRQLRWKNWDVWRDASTGTGPTDFVHKFTLKYEDYKKHFRDEDGKNDILLDIFH